MLQVSELRKLVVCDAAPQANIAALRLRHRQPQSGVKAEIV